MPHIAGRNPGASPAATSLPSRCTDITKRRKVFNNRARASTSPPRFR